MTPDSEDFARRFVDFIDEMRQLSASADSGGSGLGRELEQHLGADPRQLAPVSASHPEHRSADLDIALHQLAERYGGRWVGVRSAHRDHFDAFADLLEVRFGSVEVGPVNYARQAIGPDVSRQIVSLGILLLRVDGTPLALLVRSANPRYGRDTTTTEILCPDAAVAEACQAQLETLMTEHSVLRGQVMSFGLDEYGNSGSGVTFHARPSVAADDVILPAGLRELVARHVVEMGGHVAQLRAAGQHLKRGVLLYGPPGTGKTHLIRHLLTITPGTTAVLLTGRTLGQLSRATSLARAMQPAMIVMEDCDLVAEQRGGEVHAELFETLEAMDGLSGDADITFVLTTNRPDLLERALVERPGRVDLAVAIDRPDRVGRLRLFQLYAAQLLRDGHLTPAALQRGADQTAGVTASFAREVIRRCVIAAAVQDRDVTDADLDRELTGLLSDGETFTRSILGGHAGGPDAV